ncbi:FG-GAP-like repeat-containing protein [Myxococcota bacterium]|nr:FG-GAP-like repeat-containing protein [Myxococcota bacterium]
MPTSSHGVDVPEPAMSGAYFRSGNPAPLALLLVLLAGLANGCGPSTAPTPPEDDDTVPTDDDSAGHDDDSTPPDDDSHSGDDDTTPDDDTSPSDADGDGYPSPEDCDDSNPAIHPGAPDACDGIADTDCDGEPDPREHDGDGDGVSECQEDCEDDDPAIHPGAEEICDDRDNDCDLTIDEGFDPWRDDDGDGWAPCVGDCDDADPARSPAAPEACDGIDQDCDGLFDEDFDVDRDGFTTCAGDCDDTDPTVHRAMPEACDGRDQDCDGTAGDEEVDADRDGATPCTGDCDDTTFLVGPGLGDTCNDARDSDCDPATCAWRLEGHLDEGTEILLTTSGDLDRLGTRLVTPGDLTGDGIPDLLVGAASGYYQDSVPGEWDWYEGSGAAYLIAGPIDDFQNVALEAVAHIGGSDSATYGDASFGSVVDGGEDLDGDGQPDVVLGLPYYGDGDAGAVALYRGPLSGHVYLESSAYARGGGEADGDHAGTAVAMGGDWNGDGHPDLAVGAPQAESVAGTSGVVYVLLGPLPAGPFSLADAPVRLVGEEGDFGVGSDLAFVGDLDGDGRDELAVAMFPGVPSDLCIVAGGATGEIALSDARARWEEVGSTLAVGDVTGDGEADLVVADWEVYLGMGTVRVLPLAATGVHAAGEAVATITGADGSFGSGLSAGGDLDGDGWGDLAVGALLATLDGPGGAEWYPHGAAWLFTGPLAGPMDESDAFAWVGTEVYQWLGASVLVADLDGDGQDDWTVGAPGYDVQDLEEVRDYSDGRIWVARGGPPGCTLEPEVPATDAWLDSTLPSSFHWRGDCDTYRLAFTADRYEGTTRVYTDWIPDHHIQPAASVLEPAWEAAYEFFSGQSPIWWRVEGRNADGPPSAGPWRQLRTEPGRAFSDGEAAFVPAPGERARAAGPAGDLDGDGWRDVAVRVSSESGGADDPGALYVVSGPEAATISLENAEARVHGTETHSNVGQGADGTSDLDGDGQADLVVAGDDAAWVFLGPVVGDLSVDDADWAFSFTGIGYSLASAGDLDGDGTGDVVIPGYEGGWLAFGPFGTGTEVVLTVAGSPGALLAPAGDVNGDGAADLLMGDPDAGGGDGAVCVFYGPFAAAPDLATAMDCAVGSGGEEAGTEVLGPGDVDGDGFDDLLVRAPNRDDGVCIGAVQVVHGPVLGVVPLSAGVPLLCGGGDWHSPRFGPWRIGDVDGDGRAEVLAYIEVEEYGQDYLRNFLFFGPDGSRVTEMWGSPSVAGTGDVDSDGRDDVLAYAWGTVVEPGEEGAAFLHTRLGE